MGVDLLIGLFLAGLLGYFIWDDIQFGRKNTKFHRDMNKADEEFKQDKDELKHVSSILRICGATELEIKETFKDVCP